MLSKYQYLSSKQPERSPIRPWGLCVEQWQWRGQAGEGVGQRDPADLAHLGAGGC